MASSSAVSVNVSSFVWFMANDLWGDFKHTDFSRIILPFLVFRRIRVLGIFPSKLTPYNCS